MLPVRSASVDPAAKSHALLEVARRDFPAFYARGNERDRRLLDMLVLVTALVVSMNANRATAEAAGRRIDEACDAAHRAFTDLRTKVRSSPTFAALPILERFKIESALFQREPRQE